MNKSQDEVPMSVVKEGAVNLVTAVFNILMSASHNADFRHNHLKQENDRNKVGFMKCNSLNRRPQKLHINWSGYYLWMRKDRYQNR